MIPVQVWKRHPLGVLFLTWSFWFGCLAFISKSFLNHFKPLLSEVPLRHHLLWEGSLYPLQCFSNIQIKFHSTSPDGPLTQNKTQALAQPIRPTRPAWHFPWPCTPPAHLPGFFHAALFYSHWNSSTRWLFLVKCKHSAPHGFALMLLHLDSSLAIAMLRAPPACSRHCSSMRLFMTTLPKQPFLCVCEFLWLFFKIGKLN